MFYKYILQIKNCDLNNLTYFKFNCWQIKIFRSALSINFKCVSISKITTNPARSCWKFKIETINKQMHRALNELQNSIDPEETQQYKVLVDDISYIKNAINLLESNYELKYIEWMQTIGSANASFLESQEKVISKQRVTIEYLKGVVHKLTSKYNSCTSTTYFKLYRVFVKIW